MRNKFLSKAVSVFLTALILVGAIFCVPISADSTNIIRNSTFDSNVRNWGFWTSGTGEAEIKCEDSKLVLYVLDPGTKSWDIQLWHEYVRLYKNGKYKISFDISASTDMKISFYLEGEKSYIKETIEVSKNTYTYKTDLEMLAETDLMVMPKFQCGAKGSDSYEIYLDNFVIELVDDSNVSYDGFVREEASIIANQVGYKPDAVKVAVFRNFGSAKTFNVVNSLTGEVVYTGEIYGEIFNEDAKEANAYGDFSSVTEEGTYYITCEGCEDSYPFEIKEDVYGELTDALVKMLYYQRCGCEVVDDDFGHPACHTGDAIVLGSDETVDVSGGWHDAGDYGKYVTPGAKTVADILQAYRANPGLFSDNTGINESGNGIPDILDEARYEIEWILKMQSGNGGVYHKATTESFCGTIMPEEDTAQMYVTPISTLATADACAVYAMAYEFYKDIDPEFANKCLEASFKAWLFLEKNPDLIYVDPEEIGTGAYSDSNDAQERYFAAAALYSVTKDEKYADYILNNCDEKSKKGIGTGSIGVHGSLILLNMDGISENDEIYVLAMESVIKQADEFMSIANEHPYMLTAEKLHWGSNGTLAGNASILSLAYKLTGNEAYNKAAYDTIDYLLGRNAVNTCFVTGFGTLYTDDPHHRPSRVIGKTVPGMVAGGVNYSYDGTGDLTAKAYLYGMPSAKCYFDVAGAYCLNEITIYWNSPFIFLLSLTEPYSSDAEGVTVTPDLDGGIYNTSGGNLPLILISAAVIAVVAVAVVIVVASKKKNKKN